MDAGLMSLLAGALGVIVVALLACLVILVIRRSPGPNITVQSSIQHMRSIGQLSVFKVITKEIVTETDHTWGDFGAKYMQWVLTNKKMAMIFEFEIDFRYDLRRPEFEIIGASNSSYIIKMPPCFFEAHIRDIRFDAWALDSYDDGGVSCWPWGQPSQLIRRR